MERRNEFVEASGIGFEIDFRGRGHGEAQFGQSVFVHGVKAWIDFEGLEAPLTDEADVVVVAMVRIVDDCTSIYV